MSLFPQFSVPDAGRGGDLPLYADVAMDYDAGTPIWEGGGPVVVTGLEAVKSWAWRAVATARYRYPAFSWDYGCELENLVGQPYLADTKRSEAARYIQDALLASPYITACSVTDVTFDGSTFHMTVDFSTVYGKEDFMFEDRTQANIKAEALALLSQAAGVSALAGSYADATLGAVAGQLSELYQALPAVVSMLFVDEYSGPYIDLVGSTYFNILRRPGTKARCSMTFTGAAGTVLPAGTVFLTRSGLEFLLLEAVAIPQKGTATGTLEAAETGAAYNVGEGEIDRMYINPVGLSSYVNGQATGGTDTESDAALLARIRERRERPANGANGWQYRQWALSVAGVGEAKIVELSDGPGTVGVTIVDSSMAPASPEIVEAVRAELEENRPVGAKVIAAAPGAVELSVSARVVITAATTAEKVRETFAARLREYFQETIRAKYGTIYYGPEEDGPYTVIYNRILALLLTIDGVENAAGLTVNGGTDDVTIQADEAPVLGTVEVTA